MQKSLLYSGYAGSLEIVWTGRKSISIFIGNIKTVDLGLRAHALHVWRSCGNSVLKKSIILPKTDMWKRNLNNAAIAAIFLFAKIKNNYYLISPILIC
jgi:hypothetical protein